MEDKKTHEADADASKKEEQQKLLTQEQVNEIVSERVARTEKKYEKLFDEKLAEARAELEKDAKLSAEEREKESKAREEKIMQERKKELDLRQNKLDAISKLDELKIPIQLVDLVVSEDADKTESNISALTDAWNKAIAEGVEARVSGKAQKDIGLNSKDTPKGVTMAF